MLAEHEGRSALTKSPLKMLQHLCFVVLAVVECALVDRVPIPRVIASVRVLEGCMAGSGAFAAGDGAAVGVVAVRNVLAGAEARFRVQQC